MVSLISFFDGLGWIGNLTAVVSCFFGVGIFIRWLRKRVQSLTAPPERSLADACDKVFGDRASVARKLLKIQSAAIVDDKPDDFPLEQLRSMFKSVKVIESISLTEWTKLQKFDWIFLDVKGVVPEDLESGGLQLLKRLREIQPGPVLVAVSSKRFDPTVTEYFQLANTQMKKPLLPVECEEKILALVDRKLGPHSIAASIDQEFQQLDSGVADALRGRIMRDLQRSEMSDSLQTDLEKAVGRSSAHNATLSVKKLISMSRALGPVGA